MIRALLSFALLAPVAALAQQPAPPPKAIEITAAEYAELEKWLAEQPFKFAAPMLQFLQKKQSAAQMPPPPPPPAEK